ncbi:MAG: S-adenosylmethionine:tRNA ribosyltransferase-isomerase [Streptosporangiaceae bacterium]
MRNVASKPAEERGLARDGVRMLVATTDGLAQARFADLPRFLACGDLLVVNTTATLPAAVDGERGAGGAVTVHFSTPLEDGTWVAELREATAARARLAGTRAGEQIALPAGAELTLLRRYPDPDADRLWTVSLRTAGENTPGRVTGRGYEAVPARAAGPSRATSPGRAAGPGREAIPGRAAGPGDEVLAYLAEHGRPIRYSYVPEPWPLAAYQTVFSREPGSAEMPSAGRPFTERLAVDLITAGVVIAPITLHAGVASLETHEPPLPERFRVSESTARLINLTRSAGRRVVAVGTTVTRALESVAGRDGSVSAGEGWTGLVLGGANPARAVTGLITGWHDPEASHLALLEAVAGPALVKAAYAEAEKGGYLGHEFGDSCLLLPPL